MNKLETKGDWNITKGKLRQKWAKLTDDDLPCAEGEQGKLLGRLQKRSRVAAGSVFAKPMPILQSHVAAEETSDTTEVPVWKRMLDVTCICLALPGVLLVTVLIAAVIKTVSPGPVFFKQERVGHRRARFMCWKFRTMRSGADTAAHQQHLKELLQSDAPLTKMDAAGDRRLIPCGAMLRATGLDELPQLINVLRGEMSLVGPRPCTPYEEESYRPCQQARFDTLPGLTGLWQVSGKNKTTFTEMVTLDMLYARNKSLWLDLKIMAGTVSVLVSQVREARGRTGEVNQSPAPVRETGGWEHEPRRA